MIFKKVVRKNMKARVPVTKNLNQKQKAELSNYIQEMGLKIYREESAGLFRRYFKLIAVALNKHYGFGTKRIMVLFDEFVELTKERDSDKIFWRHIDEVIKDELKLPFDREDYESLDG